MKWGLNNMNKTLFKWGNKYLVGKTPNQILDRMMEDIFIHETIPADYMKAVAKRAYIYDFSIINTESERHFIDSYQILNLVGNKKKVLDIGSGAGFPAIVCAICSDNIFHLVDSNKKKCLFTTS